VNPAASRDDPHNTRPRVRALALGLCTAILLAAAFPPVGLWWCSILIPVPLMRLARRPMMRPLHAALWGGLGTLPAWVWNHAWVLDVSELGAPFLMLYLALYASLFVWIGAAFAGRSAAPVPALAVVWVGVEFLRATVVLTGYPWYLAIHPVIDAPGALLAAPAGWGGVPLVGLFGALVSAALALSFERGRRLGAGVWALGTLALWIGLGFVAAAGRHDPGERVVFGVIQPDIPQDNRSSWTPRQRISDWIDLGTMTIASARDKERTPDLIVWPEGLSPGWTLDQRSREKERAARIVWKLRARSEDDAPGLESKAAGLPGTIPATQAVEEMLMMQERLGIPMVIGGPGFENLALIEDEDGFFDYESDAKYNSVFVLSGGRVDDQRYDKMHLTPFGEVMPLISRSDALESWLLGLGAVGMSFDLDAGSDPVVLRVPIASRDAPLRLATPICFEATVASVCRRLVYGDGGRRADVLVNLTNDGWFGGSRAGRRTHMLTARWRCVELGTPMVRCANTGVSCVVDARGVVVDETLNAVIGDEPNAGYINAPVRTGRGRTLYATIGDTFGWAAALAAVLMGIMGIIGGAGLRVGRPIGPKQNGPGAQDPSEEHA